VPAPRARGFLALTVAAVATSASLPATPSATIFPQHGIAGIRLTMTQKRVRSILGAPAEVKRGTNEFGRYTDFRYPGLRVSFQGNGGVTNISTTRRSERTLGGVGVGSTEGQVRAKVRRVTCRRELGSRHCFLGAFRAGRRVTDFLIRRGRVVRVDVGFVID
jgi:hypothetical protein